MMASTRSAGSKRWTVVGGTLLATAAVVAAPVAASASQPKRLTALQQGMNYYKGKAITFVAADNVGGGFDQYARAYAPYLAKYLGATVNVVNIPAGNTVAGQDTVARAIPNGLTVGWLNAGPDIEDTILNLPGLNFNPERVAMLGGSAPSNNVVASLTSAACSQWSSWKAVVQNSSASNPVTEPIQTTGSTTFELLLANGVFGVHYRAIPGYASSSALLAGWERGDGCVIIDPVSTVGPLIAGGKARPLLLTTALQPTNAYVHYFSGVPTIAQAERSLSKSIANKTQKAAVPVLNQAVTTSRGFFTNGATPAPQVAALRAAFQWASNNKNLENTLTAEGSPTGYQNGPSVKANYIAFLAGARRVTEYLAAIGG
jgi:tripartite-type tricarboxylate transporter receptor subunit TctC